MNQRQLDLLRSSYERLRPIPKSCGTRFYEHLFRLDPSLEPLFKGSLENQAAMLVTALGLSIAQLGNEGYLPPSLRELGARHMDYGVPEGAYGVFGESLLHTLRDALGESFTLEVRDAWAAAYCELAQSMRAGAATARIEREEAQRLGDRTI